MKRRILFSAGLLLASQFLPCSAQAAVVALNGDNVDYSFDDGLLGLFGQPGLSGDSLFFYP